MPARRASLMISSMRGARFPARLCGGDLRVRDAQCPRVSSISATSTSFFIIGSAAELLTEENLSRYYDIDCRVTETRVGDEVHRGLLTLL